ncbi:MAG: excisionase family DNA-binding protein [Chthonomonas sp.]|nr:excisionase family DNA-binding protein [Chthonomonas sp.]
MSKRTDRRIEPSEISPEILKQLDGLIHTGGASLVGRDGERIDLPIALNELLVFIVDSMKRRQTIFMMPEDEAFTTQAAANFLGVSRPFLLKLLANGRIPFHRVGTHRRIVFRDLLVFQDARNKERREALSEMTRMLDEAGVYDRRLELED